jgi:glutamate-1-semialdehyde 2,1-aminomutase
MDQYGRMHRALLDQGVYLAPSGWEVGFMSAAHTDQDVETTLAAVSRALKS